MSWNLQNQHQTLDNLNNSTWGHVVLVNVMTYKEKKKNKKTSLQQSIILYTYL
jgi:hypothetical protein